jgi:hypothetical protein
LKRNVAAHGLFEPFKSIQVSSARRAPADYLKIVHEVPAAQVDAIIGLVSGKA